MIEKGEYVDFEILSNGNLRISLNANGKIELTEMNNLPEERLNDYDKLRELMEFQLCNGWAWVNSEDVSALTDAPILSDDANYNDDGIMEVNGEVWWYPDYQTIDLAKELLETGELIFTKAEED